MTSNLKAFLAFLDVHMNQPGAIVPADVAQLARIHALVDEGLNGTLPEEVEAELRNLGWTPGSSTLEMLRAVQDCSCVETEKIKVALACAGAERLAEEQGPEQILKRILHANDEKNELDKIVESLHEVTQHHMVEAGRSPEDAERLGALIERKTRRYLFKVLKRS